ELSEGPAAGGDERLSYFQTDGLHEALDRVDDAAEAPPAVSSAGGATCVSLSHEGETCRGSGDGPAGRLRIQPVRDPGGGVRHPASYRRGVLQTRVFRRALRGPGALCDDVVRQGLLVERMHLGRLPVLIGRGAARALTLDRTDARSRAAGGSCPRTEGDLVREQERTPEHGSTSVHRDEVPVELVARARHQSCSPPSLRFGRSE